MNDDRVIKVLVLSDAGVCTIDAIEYEGRVCLVPEWIDTQKPGYSRPARTLLAIVPWPALYQGDLHPQALGQVGTIPMRVLDGLDPPAPDAFVEAVPPPSREFETHYDGPAS